MAKPGQCLDCGMQRQARCLFRCGRVQEGTTWVERELKDTSLPPKPKEQPLGLLSHLGAREFAALAAKHRIQNQGEKEET